MNDLIFVYGTLLDAENKYGLYLRDNSGFYSPAKVRGKLFDIGQYPGVVLYPDGDDEVHGVLMQMDDPETILNVIDIYEGFGSDQPQPNEFIRILADAETDHGPVTCWVYIYNHPLANISQIASGKYFK